MVFEYWYKFGLIFWFGLVCGAEKGGSTYYVNPLSYSTTRDPDPPKYSGVLSGSGWSGVEQYDWLVLGLDYRLRVEYRDDDLRRGREGVDIPFLHRTRFYLGVKEVLDPLRFAVEIEDSRRYGSEYERDNRDVNEFEPIRLYAELYFANWLAKDGLGHDRPVSLRAGLMNFELLDRRLFGNNQWRNTANGFRGFYWSVGQECNDWQVEGFALQAMNRLKYELDRPVEQQWLYGVVGHWRGFGKVMMVEPHYFALNQSAYEGVVERLIHAYGMRVYGILEGCGFDYDLSFMYQNGRNGALDHEAVGLTAEVGYRWDKSSRLSLFYAYASGDQHSGDGRSGRFEKFYGFGRPWSANDYINYENVSAPKVRWEQDLSRRVKMDMGYSYYWLASGSDRFLGGNGARDSGGKSGTFLGHEFDGRVRFQLSKRSELIVGYAHFESGDFVERKIGRDDTDFFYMEWTIRLY